MSDITPERKMIQNEETAAEAAVSESTMTRIGAGINYINTYQQRQWTFGGVGPLDIITSFPYLGLGFEEVFDYNAEIVNVRAQIADAGSSGDTEVDIKWAPAGSSSYNSIFSTKPKVNNAAADDSFCDANTVVATPSGWTQPVLSKTTFDTGDRLRFDLIGVATASKDIIITIYWRVR